MRRELVTVEYLAGLLGSNRSNSEVVRLIDELGDLAAFKIDREDDADDEYIEVKDLGLCLYFEANRLVSIFLYSEVKGEDYARYAQPLPLGISFEQSKSDVMSSIGDPSNEGGGKEGYFGYIAEWITYDMRGLKVHVEFSREFNAVQMVTLMPCAAL